jgi:hypothetical protein
LDALDDALDVKGSHRPVQALCQGKGSPEALQTI